MNVRAGSVGRVIGVALLALSAVAAASAGDEDPWAARSVVHRYFDALSQGDIGAFEELLGGRFWERTARRIASPNYSTFLQERYASSHYSIEETHVLETAQGGVEVEVELSMPGGEPDTYTFLLRRDSEADSYRILAEF